MDPANTLLAASALHPGFQAGMTVMVYRHALGLVGLLSAIWAAAWTSTRWIAMPSE